MMRRVLLLIGCLLLIPTIASAQLQSSPDLDYDALIASPDAHKDEVYMIAGDVAVVQSPPEDSPDDAYTMLLVSLDGDATRPVYIAYTPRAEQASLRAGDSIWSRTVFLNTIPYKTTLGFYVTLPLFYTPTAPIIQEE
jgi:hypothetical protein